MTFSIKYSNSTLEYETTFTPSDDPISNSVNWTSSDGKIVVRLGFLGGWMAYRYPQWEKLRFWGFPSKETAALAGVVKWADQS
jgi:hypothetical protein